MLSYIKIILIFAMLSTVTGGYFYIRTLQAELKTAAEVQAKLESAVAAEKQVREQQAKDLEKMRILNAEISVKFAAAQKDASDLQRKFNDMNAKAGNMTQLAQQKPKELEAKINRGTKFAMRCNEIVTGSPLKPEDDQNNICAELIKSRKQP